MMVTIREPNQCDIELDGETQVEQLKYLESIFCREGAANRMSKQGA